MLKPKGLQNLGSTCYINALIQTLVSSKKLLDNLKINDITQELINFNSNKRIDINVFLKYLPKEAFDSHEALFVILDKLPSDLFKLDYETEDNIYPLITKYYCSEDLYYFDVLNCTYKLIYEPDLLFVLKNKDIQIQNLNKYKLISFINFNGGHYVSISLRDKNFYLFDDNNYKINLGIPDSNTVILLYEHL